MDQSQIYSYARGAGLSDAHAKVAAAIAMAESGGNPSAVVHDSDDDSYGLWQINMKAHSTTSLGISSANALLDPATNARAMSQISHQGNSFGPWTTYTSGKYKQWMGKSVSLVDVGRGIAAGASDAFSDTTGQLISLPGDVVDAFAKLSDGLSRTTRWVSTQKNWLRIAYVVGGGLLLYAAVETMVLPYSTKAVNAVMSGAKKVGI